ncbi:MAG: AsmA family protein [Hydrogenovibrio sp.]|nr:AsmA family protein [Hydrogenovibrio sp.]
MSTPSNQPLSETHDHPVEHSAPQDGSRKPSRYADRHPFFKWFRRIFVVFLMLPVVVFLGFWGAMQFVDFNQYKPTIEKEFLEKTGHRLKINGAIEVSVIPFVMSAKQLEVKNPKGFDSQKDLADIQAVELELSLWDLFIHRQLSIQGLEIEQPTLNLITNQSGQRNWQFFQNLAGFSAPLKQGLRSVAYVPVVKNQANLKAVDDKEDWQLRSLILQNAQLNWTNLLNQHQYQLQDFDMMAFDLAPNTPFNVITEFDFSSNRNKAKFHVKLSHQLEIAQHFKSWKAMNWQGTLVTKLPDRFKLPEVRVESNGSLFSVNMKTNQLEVKSAVLKSLDSSLKLDMSYDFGSQSHSRGHIESKNIQLRKWLRHSGIRTPKFVHKWALSKVTLNMDWEHSANQLALKNIDMVLDQSHITGKLLRQIQNDGLSRTHFDLNVDQLDLDKYQAIAEERKKAWQARKLEKQKAGASVPKRQPPPKAKLTQTYLPLALPISTLREMKAEGKLHFGRLKAWNLAFEDASITLLADKGRLDLAPLDAKLYQGQLQSKLTIDVTGKTPRYLWSGRVEKVQLQPMLTDGWGNEHLSGTYNGHFDLRTAGVNGHLLKQNMSGYFEAQVQNGAYQGMDLNKLLAGRSSSAKDSTQFDRLKLEGEIAKGIFTAQKLNLNSERFSSIGVGTLNLPKGEVKGHLYTTYRKPPASLQKLKGLEVPVYLKGPLGEIQWQVDLNKLLQSRGNQQKLLKGLQQLFGQR